MIFLTRYCCFISISTLILFWVQDSPDVSVFRRHKKALAESLTEMKRKSIKDAKTEDRRVDAIRWELTSALYLINSTLQSRQMEEAALQDYRDKDVHSSRDFTAKLYNGEKLPDTEGVVVKQGPQQNPFANSEFNYFFLLSLSVSMSCVLCELWLFKMKWATFRTWRSCEGA